MCVTLLSTDQTLRGMGTEDAHENIKMATVQVRAMWVSVVKSLPETLQGGSPQ